MNTQYLFYSCHRDSIMRVDGNHGGFLETDFSEDLNKFDIPPLILHGYDDQIVPIGDSAMVSSKIIKGSKLKVYPVQEKNTVPANLLR